MKAVIFEKYGPPEVLQIKEIEKPVPKDDEVLIKIHATTATSAEKMMRTGRPLWGRLILGLTRPKRKYRIPGIEFSGVIDSAGKNVDRFTEGDDIYGFAGFQPGACAEYKCMPQHGSMCLKPENLSLADSAAAVDGATTALFFLKEKAKIKPGQKVLVIGASGSIGTYAIQVAKYFGGQVTGVCSTPNIELVYSLGANCVIDYTKVDFTKTGKKYDIIFDTVGKSSYSKCKSSLTNNGLYIPTTNLINYWLMLWTSIFGGKKVLTGMSVEKNQLLVLVKQIIEEGKIKPVIDRYYSINQIVEAHKYVGNGHKKGNVVITM